MTLEEVLLDLANRRGSSSSGYNCLELITKLNNGSIVEMTAFEPDATTYRNEFYYNIISNTLYKRIVVSDKPKIGKLYAVWKPANTID